MDLQGNSMMSSRDHKHEHEHERQLIVYQPYKPFSSWPSRALIVYRSFNVWEQCAAYQADQQRKELNAIMDRHRCLCGARRRFSTPEHYIVWYCYCGFGLKFAN
jgi:hypothetical protein